MKKIISGLLLFSGIIIAQETLGQVFVNVRAGGPPRRVVYVRPAPPIRYAPAPYYVAPPPVVYVRPRPVYAARPRVVYVAPRGHGYRHGYHRW